MNKLDQKRQNFREQSLQDNQSKEGAPSSPPNRLPYWDKKFIVTNAVILLLALISAILEYEIYSAIISNGYPEQNVTLKLSILTFRYDAIRCYGSSTGCLHLNGIPALDFFQIFVLVAVVYNIMHMLGLRKARNVEEQSETGDNSPQV